MQCVRLRAEMMSPGAPTIVLGGFTMHRISGEDMNPYLDTEAKIASIPIFRGAKVRMRLCEIVCLWLYRLLLIYSVILQFLQ